MLRIFLIVINHAEGGAEKKSVIVYIHGGAFTEGFADEDAIGPDLFLDADTVVVYIIYRVGVFGFLNLGFGDYTGNMGLKDQQLALRWIYENIENFSGNKDEILLFGISAGIVSSPNIARIFEYCKSVVPFYVNLQVLHQSIIIYITKIPKNISLVQWP